MGLTIYDIATEASSVLVLEYADKISDNMTLIDNMSGQVRQTAVEMIIGDGTSSIATGFAGYIEVPHPFVLEAVRMFADTTGNMVLDVWKSTFSSFPPNSGNSIVGAHKPTLSSAQKSETVITDWTGTWARGDILAISIVSVTTIKMVTISFSGYIPFF